MNAPAPATRFRIRLGGEEDLIQVRRIAQATWPDTFRNILSPAQIEYMLAWLYAIDRLRQQVRTGEHVFHLADIDDEPVGFAAHQCECPRPGATKIHKLYLLPAAQGRGIGRALVDAVREIAESSGHDTLTLNVNKHNDAIRFYEAYGFRKGGEEVIDIGGGYVMDDFIMNLSLPLPPAGDSR